MTKTAMGPSVLDTLPETPERLPLRFVQETLVAEILERG